MNEAPRQQVKYRILERAGDGGMAIVWRGLTLGAAGFTRPVAIKRLHRSLVSNPEFVAMFVEEARVVSLLSHPNVVQIHDFGQDQHGAYFLVMEWIDGLDLGAWQRAHALEGYQTPWHLVLALGIEILKALEAAHDHIDEHDQPSPIYHRDVSPANILIGRNGVLKLTDFGLARAMDRARTTQPHIIKGKLSYVAPEATQGAEPTAQRDIYGVGVVLWETLVGRKLYDDPDVLELFRRVREEPPPHLLSVRPDVPPPAVDAIHRALAKDPRDRFTSAREMARALAAVLRHTDAPTDARILSESVNEARNWLGRHSLVPQTQLSDDGVGGGDTLSVTDPSGAIPLTQRK